MQEKVKVKSNIFIVWVLCGILLIVTTLVWSKLFDLEEGVLTVAFLDIGQGDAIFIETPSGNQVLIDGGKGRAVLRELGKLMSFYDRSIDVVLATHPDMDHIGGLPDVFKRYDVDLFIESGVEDGGADSDALEVAIKNKELNTVTAKQGMNFMLDDGVFFQIFFPDRDASNLEANTGSIVVKLIYGETSFMLTGDSPAGIETYLSSIYGEALKSDVLKLGHHGSKTSSSDIFLGFVDPEYAVISASCDNQYGHPHKEVLEKLERFDIKKLSTCENGTIVFKSDGKNISVK